MRKPSRGVALGERDAHVRPVLLPSSAIAATAAVVDEDFEAAARFVGAHVVEHEHEFGEAEFGALRHRHEDFAPAAEVGKPKAVGISDVRKQNADHERLQRALRERRPEHRVQSQP